MIFGSHNTMTYLRPKYWFMRLFGFAYKCQDKTLAEQIKSGVHSIDIRVRFRQNGGVYFCHGLYESKLELTVDNMVNFIVSQVKHGRVDNEPIYVRIILETYKEDAFQEYHFTNFIKIFNLHLKGVYSDVNMSLYGSYRKFDWKKLYTELPDNTTEEPISSVASNARWYEKVWPRAYAKRMNEINLPIYDESKNIVIFDFV